MAQRNLCNVRAGIVLITNTHATDIRTYLYKYGVRTKHVNNQTQSSDWSDPTRHPLEGITDPFLAGIVKKSALALQTQWPTPS
jgi:hypothetical protein